MHYHLFKLVGSDWEYVGPVACEELAHLFIRLAARKGIVFDWLAF